LQGEVEANHGQGRSLAAENSCRTERADHLIVAHVNNPNIALMRGALASDGEDHVGVDSGGGGIDDFELSSGKTFAQQHFHVTGRAVGGLRIAHGGGFAEDKNACGVGFFFCRYEERARPAGQGRGKKSQGKGIAVGQEIFPAHLYFAEEAGGITITGPSQAELGHTQEQ
jgi:hypothetical protein